MMITGITSGSARAAHRAGELAQRGAAAPDPGRPEQIAVDHQADPDQHARHDAAEEQAGDRDVAGRAVDHRHDRGRDQVRDGRGRCDQRRGEAAIVALAIHLGRDRAAEDRDVRGRAARDAGEEHREQRHHLGEAAAQVADQGLGEHDHPPGDVGRGHQLADQQEERHREQRLGVEAVEQLADHRGHADRGQHGRREHARP